MTHERLSPDTVHPTKGYSHASKVGDLLFVAGQVAQDRDLNVVGVGDMEAQAHQTYRNLRSVLEAAGSDLNHIVKMTTYLVDRAHIETYRAVKSEYFTEPMPPNTLCLIDGLASPEFLIEVEAVAAL